jgi:DNA polymerase III alpha subunit
VAGVVRAHLAAKEVGLRLLIGTEIGLHGGPRLVLLAQDRAGYGDLCELITQGRRAAAKGEYRLGRADLERFGLQRCLAPWLPTDPPGRAAGAWLAARFAGRCWLAVKLFGGLADGRRLTTLRELGRELALPLVAAGDVHMHRRGRRALQDVLTAIRLGRPVDVGSSAWDCTLEVVPTGRGGGQGDGGRHETCDSPALRLGLRLVKGLSREGADRLVAVRGERPFADVDDLARRGRLDRRDLEALAGAGALAGLTGNRHQARWRVTGVAEPPALWCDTATEEGTSFLQEAALPMLRASTEGEDIVADYASLGLTLGRHPLASNSKWLFLDFRGMAA